MYVLYIFDRSYFRVILLLFCSFLRVLVMSVGEKIDVRA